MTDTARRSGHWSFRFWGEDVVNRNILKGMGFGSYDLKPLRALFDEIERKDALPPRASKTVARIMGEAIAAQGLRASNPQSGERGNV